MSVDPKGLAQAVASVNGVSVADNFGYPAELRQVLSVAISAYLAATSPAGARPLTPCHAEGGCIRAYDDDTCGEQGQCSIVLALEAQALRHQSTGVTEDIPTIIATDVCALETLIEWSDGRSTDEQWCNLHGAIQQIATAALSAQERAHVTDPAKTEQVRGDVSGWQDTSTAPRDKTKVLVARIGEGPIIARQTPMGVWLNCFPTREEDRVLDGDKRPTHWMPRPTPPAAEEV